MKTIGILGGMSWESTLNYYRLLNEGVNARLGGFHSAPICLLSVDFAETENASRERFLGIIDEQRAQGAEAVILGCTEIAMLVQQTHTAVPLYDTTQLHVLAALNRAFENDSP